jgi:hypothetical protein
VSLPLVPRKPSPHVEGVLLVAAFGIDREEGIGGIWRTFLS